MSKHAYLSASASGRWIACPPSAKLCADLPDSGSSYAREGTDCHELCAYLVEKALGRDVEDPVPGLEYYNQEMQDCAEEYRNFVIEQYEGTKEKCGDPLIFIEQKLDFSEWVEDGYGTGDCIIIADGILHIIDYKHGVGVLVSAEDNSQMKCYALGALRLYDRLYDIKDVQMTIFQPRRANISTCMLTKENLLLWADEILRPAAELAYRGLGEFNAGDHCMFCKAKAICTKRAEYHLELAKHDFAPPDTLDESEIAEILSMADSLTKWVSDVKEYALSCALSGTKYPGFKVVEGRSVRKYTDEKAVAEAVRAAGFDPYESKLLGITAMSKLLGRKMFDELLSGLIHKPPGKPALAPENDKRPQYCPAAADFNDGFNFESQEEN